MEINPLILTGKGDVVALDAKMTFDDNALYRHEDIVAMRDLDEEDPAEIEASKYGLSYISLDGDIGCLVNGAGLAMATMDTIKLFGGEPANFLDVGGGANAEKVTAAFKIMLANKKVKAILVNIFGGIMKCDTIANGIVTAAREVELSVPLVVRMKGTNEDLGKQILKDSGLPIISADNMADAARKVVATLAKKPAAKAKSRKSKAAKKPRAVKKAKTAKKPATRKAAPKAKPKKTTAKRNKSTAKPKKAAPAAKSRTKPKAKSKPKAKTKSGTKPARKPAKKKTSAKSGKGRK